MGCGCKSGAPKAPKGKTPSSTVVKPAPKK